MSEPIACIDFLVTGTGEPGVRLAASPEFMDLDAVKKCLYIAAAMQLCGVAIQAICDDNPDLADEIRQNFPAVSISPASQRTH